eukprot:170543_1
MDLNNNINITKSKLLKNALKQVLQLKSFDYKGHNISLLTEALLLSIINVKQVIDSKTFEARINKNHERTLYQYQVKNTMEEKQSDTLYSTFMLCDHESKRLKR